MFKLLLHALLAALIYAASIPTDASESDAVLQIEERIVGGREASIIKHPHQISLRYKSFETDEFSHLCGGSIYNASVIISAAHCLSGRNAKGFIVVAGSIHRSGSDGVIVPVARAVMHEKYNGTTFDNDVAIFFLALDIPLNNHTIAPIKLASQNPNNGVKSIVTGWGRTSTSGPLSDVLLEVEVPIVGIDLCRKAYGYEEEDITDNMLCAGTSLGGKDACQADSGGPLVVDSELVGIVSWGNGCALAQYPGVYASVANLKEWIENTINGIVPPQETEEVHIDFL